VVDGTGLENRQSASSRGFESHPLRQFDFRFRIESPASSGSFRTALRADCGFAAAKNRYAKRGHRFNNRAADDTGQIMRGDIRSPECDQRRKSCDPRSQTSAATGISQSAVTLHCVAAFCLVPACAKQRGGPAPKRSSFRDRKI
jgi:hypothetical protein